MSTVAKIYHDPDKLNRAKIEAMIQNPPEHLTVKIGSREYPQYAWPTRLILDQGKRAIGYVMPRIDETESWTLDYFYDRTLLAELNSADEQSLTYKLLIGRNLSTLLAELHSRRHFMIDFKPQNIKVFLRSHIVALLDCDSYSIQGIGEKTFSATNYSSQYIAPEALRNKIPPSGLYEYQDCFALAVVLFRLLNNGTHPFQGIQTTSTEFTTTDESVREGFYPHGLIPHPGITPRPQSIHQCFDDTTRAMFDRAFDATNSPSHRPSAKEWSSHFSRFLNDRSLQKCGVHPANPAHQHFAGKPCGACYLASLRVRRSWRRRLREWIVARWSKKVGGVIGAAAVVVAVAIELWPSIPPDPPDRSRIVAAPAPSQVPLAFEDVSAAQEDTPAGVIFAGRPFVMSWKLSTPGYVSVFLGESTGNSSDVTAAHTALCVNVTSQIDQQSCDQSVDYAEGTSSGSRKSLELIFVATRKPLEIDPQSENLGSHLLVEINSIRTNSATDVRAVKYSFDLVAP